MSGCQTQKKGPPTDAPQRGEQRCQCLNAKIRVPGKRSGVAMDVHQRAVSYVTFPKTCVYIYTIYTYYNTCTYGHICLSIIYTI